MNYKTVAMYGAIASLPFNFILPAQAGDSVGDKELSTITVTGQNEAQIERRDASVQKIVIAEDEIERFGDVSVGDILKRLPGISFTGPAGVAKDVRMRGLDKGYTQFLINGEPIPGATKERQLQVDRLPADMIERIEIIRNPSAEYESGNVGGIVNIVFKKRIDELTRLRVASGRNGSLNVGDVIVQTSKRYNDLDILLAASYTVGAEDIIEDKKTLHNTTGAVTGREYKPKPVEKTELLLTPRLVWRLGNDRLTLEPFVSEGTEDKTENNTVSNTTGVTSRVATTEDKKDRVSRLAGRYDGQADWGSWYLKGGTQQTDSDKDKVSWNRSYNAATGAYTGAKRDTEKEYLKESADYVGTGFTTRLNPTHLVTAGAEMRTTEYASRKPKTSQSFSATGVAGAVTSTTAVRDGFNIDEDRLVAFVQDEIRLASTHWLTPGIRYERTRREAVGGNNINQRETLTATNPSLHYRWAVAEDLNLRSSLARTMKLPKFDQLNPLVELKSGTLSAPDKGGNASLRPEKALGLELGVEKLFMGGRGIVGINGYSRSVEDFVEERTLLEGTRYVKRPFNVGDARFWGVEIDWRFPLVENNGHVLNIVGNHAEMRGRIKSPTLGNLDVKELPPSVSNIGLDYKHRPSSLFAGFSVNYVPRFKTRSINDDGVIEEKTWGDRTGLDLYLGKAFSPLAEVRLIARNLLAVEKQEDTIQRSVSTGAITKHEYKTERSKPTIMVTFESRF